jgi:hypothetical protein
VTAPIDPPCRSPVVFIVQFLETFEIVIPVVRALRRLGVPVAIVVTPERDIMLHHSEDGEWYDVERAVIVWRWLMDNGFSPEPLVGAHDAGDSVRALSPRAVFLPSPYAAQRHASLDPDALDLPIHYVDYGFHVDPEEASGWRFSDRFFRGCDAIYVANDYEAQRFLAAGVPARSVVRSGSPALDHWDEPIGRGSTPTVLWCPWWSTEGKTRGSIGYSTFLASHDEVLREFQRRPGIRMIFRPHPLMLGQLVADRTWTSDDLRRFQDRLAALPNVTVARSDIASSHVPQFEEAWAMVTDGVSFLAEFAYTGKPLLLTEVPGNPGWNPVGQAIRAVVDRSVGAAGLVPFLDRVEADADPGPASRREAVRAQYLRPVGGSGLAIAEHLRDAPERSAVT